MANTDLELYGVKGKVKTNVEAYLSSIPEKDYSTSLRFRARLESSIQEALNAVGYYHAQIHYQVDEKEDRLEVHIALGEPVRYQVVDVQISGEAQQDENFQALLSDNPMRKGKILKHNQYDSLKSSIRNLALQKGYFKGDFTKAKLEVSPELNQAFVYLYYDSGIRYQFGATSVEGSQIRENRVLSLLPYEQGDPYLINDVGELNQNLSNTGWFKSVFVEPDLSKLDESRELPMSITVTPQAKHQMEVGLGYATDVGPRGTLKWKRPWVGSRGNSFDSSLQLSQPEQIITAGYQIPLDNVLDEYYRIEYGLKNLDNNDTKSLESNLALIRYWKLDNGWHRSVFIRYLLESYTQGEQDDNAQFLLPGISFSRTRVRDPSFPSWGDKQSITLEYGNENVLSETDVLRVQGRQLWIRSYENRFRGIARVDGGANIVDDFNKLSPSLRFFAGGDNSIRGYGYESISPRDSTGALSGGKFMVTGSLEAQVRVVGNWWAATFVDAGDAFDNTPDWKTGVGFGVRWVSPIGPVRLDFAWGLDELPDDRFRIHFTLGPEL